MHELSVCMALLDQVRRIAAERNATQVSKIVLQVGPLSGVEPELLRSAYSIAAAGTIAAEASLVIEDTAVVIRCRNCGAESETAANRLVCGRCDSLRTSLVSGDEMLLQSLEFESETVSASASSTH